MARRKRGFLDDGDSSGDSDEGDDDFDEPMNADERAERDLFADPYQRKKRRKGGKDAATYGVLGDEDDEEGGTLYSKTTMRKKKAPAFVSSNKGNDKMEEDSEADEQVGDAAVEDEEDSSNDDRSEENGESEASRPASPRTRDMDEDDYEEAPKPRIGGIGFGGFSKNTKIETLNTTTADSTPAIPVERPTRGGIGSSSRVGIGGGGGGGRGGIGVVGATPVKAIDSTPELPTAFGSASFDGHARVQRSFVRSDVTRKPATPLSTDEARHFSKLQGTFGAKMLAKMGWTAGSGLGAEGQGIVTPIETKLRPEKRGIAYGGFKERTKQSKAEARRRGEAVSSDSDDDPRSRKSKSKLKAKDGKQPAADRAEQWKKPKKVKTKIQHRTYEEIMQDTGQEALPGIGVIIDATGATPREIASLSQVSASPYGATNDPTRLPELRHNLRMLGDMAKGELDGLAKEAKAVTEHKKWLLDEDARLRRSVSEEAEMIARLQNLHLVVDSIKATASETSNTSQPSLEPFSPFFATLVTQYSPECDQYGLDEIVVAAIAPVIRRMFAAWDPLHSPAELTAQLRQWRTALKMSAVAEEAEDNQALQIYGSRNGPVPTKQPPRELFMTPYESLLWNAWLPKVRSCVNNDWSPGDPQPMIQLLEAWSDLLPRFIRDNMLDQLILPKVAKTVTDWNPKREKTSLHAIVFPWLPHVGLRIEQLVGDARRKIKGLFRSWRVDEGVQKDIMVWKEVFDASEWESLLLKYIVPKLGATLREDFKINPRDQKMEPLMLVLQWSEHIRSSTFTLLLETEFFPKWLSILHIWLVQPKVNFDEVAQWYYFWQKSFPEKVYTLPGVSRGFTTGLQLVNTAMDLGADAPRLLQKPDFQPLSSSKVTPSTKSSKRTSRHPTVEITFRTIVEDYASSHNLLFVPMQKTHPISRMPLFKVSQNADGKGGLLVYILDDAVWAPDLNNEIGDDYRAIGLEDMVLRATKAKK